MITEIVILSFEFVKEQTDLSICDCCGDVIYSDSNNFYIFNGKNELISNKPELKMCNSCHDELPDKYKK